MNEKSFIDLLLSLHDMLDFSPDELDEDKDEYVNDVDDDDDKMPFEPDPCPMTCDECDEKCDDFYNFAHWEIPYVSQIIFNSPATVVKWIDGTKTIVKCSSNDRYDRYLGFAAALVKKMFGTTSRAGKFIDSMSFPMKENKKD